jgi:hypothetical protein
MLEFFNEVNDMEEFYTNINAEQAAMWITMGRPKFRPSVYICKDDSVINSLCEFSDGSCLWKAGDWMAHFAPTNCPDTAKAIVRYSQLVNKRP